MCRGVERAGYDARPLPLADGGEGTLDAILGSREGTLHSARVTGPDGHIVTAEWAALADGTAIIEMARASGLALVGAATTRWRRRRTAPASSSPPRSPTAAARVIVGVGGSATTDGGLGALDALGWTLHGVDVEVACDVTTTFLDAPAIFGPQKGASPADVAVLEERLRDLARRFDERYGVNVVSLPGSGAAGGLAGGLAAIGARIVNGFDVVAAATGFAAALEASSAVITGEGRVDASTLTGKAVARVLDAARAAGRPAAVIAGAIAPEVELDVPDEIAQRHGERRHLPRRPGARRGSGLRPRAGAARLVGGGLRLAEPIRCERAGLRPGTASAAPTAARRASAMTAKESV